MREESERVREKRFRIGIPRKPLYPHAFLLGVETVKLSVA